MAKKNSVKRHSHPGRGGRGATHPKGRQLDSNAHDQILDILGDNLRSRDLLIEYLHLIQDKYDCLSAEHLVALSEEMKIALTEVYEVATFYAHFDIVNDDTKRPPPITIRVCDSVTCEMFGAEEVN